MSYRVTAGMTVALLHARNMLNRSADAVARADKRAAAD
jgi:hypothetical protein